MSQGARHPGGRRHLLKISCLLLASQLALRATTPFGPTGCEAAGTQMNSTSQLAALAKHQQPQQQQQQQAGATIEAATSVGSTSEHIDGADNMCPACRMRPELQPASLSSSLLRAYIRTNNMRAYHLDLHAYRPEAKFVGDPAHVDSLSLAHQERCKRHLDHYDQLLASYMQADPMEMSTSLEALKLADTFGRPDAGLLEGHQFWLGSYDGCRDFSATPSGSEIAKGQYCLGLAQFPSWKAQDSRTSIKIGLCLPESCTSSMLNERADLFQTAERMMKYQLGAPNTPLGKLKLRSLYCLPHDTSQVRQLTMSGKLLIALLASLLLLCLYATGHDYLNRKTAAASAAESQVAAAAAAVTNGKEQARNWRTIVVDSFSIWRNCEKIFDLSERAETSESSRNEPATEVAPQAAPAAGLSGAREFRFNKDIFFSSITGLKCVGLIWIIAAHCFLVGPIPHKNLIGLDKLTQTYLANLLLAAHLLVDTFFALSGLLASYLLFKSNALGKMRLSQWVVLTVHRYWRLTPVYLLCYWFAKSLGHLVNSGPLWDYTTAPQSPRLHCANESWLEAILQLSDFKSPKEHCVPFAWFIANGIKFWIVTPIFLVATYKSLRAGYALMGAALVANIAIVVSLAMNSSVDMKSVIEFKPESADNMLNNMEEVYTRPYSRIGAYLVGLMAGHMIYLVESQHQPFNMSEKFKILIWSLVSATAIVLTFAVKIVGGVQLEEAAIPWVFSVSAGLIRPLWALCTCWVVFALAHGQARWLSKILSARVWKIMARLSFCAYLLQGEIIANLNFAFTHSGPYTYTDMFARPIVATVFTVGVSLVVALIVEYPLIGIEELILPKKPTGGKKVQSDEEKRRLSSDQQHQQQQQMDQLKSNKTLSHNSNEKQIAQEEACDRLVDGNSNGVGKLKEL